ncbi:MAG: Holliday junction branch migration protein RuvA [Vampirovibrionales bacterium]|nr:Holliday junction branch migration protein RuvA [Vampirovibrionales bacterium]
MIVCLNGVLLEAVESPQGASVVVDVNGVGYAAQTTSRVVRQCPAAGERVFLYTAMIVREDAMSLVGFLRRDERDLFNILQSASGVGVRVALSLLGDIGVSDIAQAVIAEDHRPLTAAKGVGPKLAQKMTLELKEKMRLWREIAPITHPGEAMGVGRLPDTEACRDAQAVLLSLGYDGEEIRRSLNAIYEASEGHAAPSSSEALLRDALRWLARA